jgi:hypothetical protein
MVGERYMVKGRCRVRISENNNMKIIIVVMALSALFMGGCARSEKHRSYVETVERSRLTSVGLEQPWKLKEISGYDNEMVREILAASNDYFSERNRSLAFDGATESADSSNVYFFFHERNAKDSNVVYVFSRKQKRNTYRFFWSGA